MVGSEQQGNRSQQELSPHDGEGIDEPLLSRRLQINPVLGFALDPELFSNFQTTFLFL